MVTEPTQPFPIIYMIGVIVLDTAIILSAMAYLQDIEIQQYSDFSNLKYSVRAARIINSPTCFALETSYILDGKTVWQVQPGIIDLEKFQGSISNECSEGELIHLELQELSPSGGAVGTPHLAGANRDASWKSKETTYYVIIDDQGRQTSGLLKYSMKL